MLKNGEPCSEDDDEALNALDALDSDRQANPLSQEVPPFVTQSSLQPVWRASITARANVERLVDALLEREIAKMVADSPASAPQA